MSTVTGTNDIFVQREFVEQKVFELMNPYLDFLDLVEKSQTTTRSVQFKRETVSDDTDTEKRAPRKRSPSAKWTYVDITPMEVDSAVLNKEGFAVRIDEDALDFVEGIDEIKRAYRKLAYWLGESLNGKCGKAYTAGVAAVEDWAAIAEWTDPKARPVEDLRKLKYRMKKKGYSYKLTDVLLNDTNMEELEGYLSALVVNDTKQAQAYGNPVVMGDKVDIPIVGTVRSLMDSIPEGSFVCIDRNNPAATMYYHNNSKYASDKIQYLGPDGTYKEVPNFGFNVKTYEEPDTHDTIIQAWFDSTVVVKEPYAGRRGTGI